MALLTSQCAKQVRLFSPIMPNRLTSWGEGRDKAHSRGIEESDSHGPWNNSGGGGMSGGGTLVVMGGLLVRLPLMYFGQELSQAC